VRPRKLVLPRFPRNFFTRATPVVACLRTGALEVSQDSLSAWYADFFTELPNALWRAAVPPEMTVAEVDFITRMSRGARVLDVPCGSGRHTLELARRGCQVTGLDVSAEAVGHARDAAAAEGLRVDLRLGDMRTLPTDIRVDTAVCMGNAFGYLDHAGTQKFLADLAGLVVPGGTLVLDYGFVAEAMLPHLEIEEPPMTIGGVEAVSVNEYDTANSRWITRFTFRRGDEEHHGTSVQHVYTSAEVTRLVTEAGFTRIALYGDTDETPFHFGSPRLLLVAHKE
jgi:SAM-dependent methyltransferase